MALPKDAVHQASAHEPFLMDCWYVAGWDHELIDGRMVARTISIVSRIATSLGD